MGAANPGILPLPMRDYGRDFFDFGSTTYLDCAYHGPFPRLTSERIRRAIEMKQNPSRIVSRNFFELPERVRGRFARIIDASPEEIALTNSATQGIGVIAAGLGFTAGDEVVISSDNFPANLFTWLHLRRLGVRVHVLKPASGVLRPEDLAPTLNPRTRLVALDWVSYTTGARIDLAELGELVRRQGALFLVDGTQGVGALEFHARALPVDILVVAAYKWLLGPYSTGFLYLTPAVQARLDLPVVNWLTVEGSEDFDHLPIEQFTLAKTAKVFDAPATANFLNLHGLDASLEYVEGVGSRTVTEHCRRLLDRLAAGLERRGFRLSAAARPECRSTILCFQGESLDVTRCWFEKLEARQVAVSLRQGMIRVSPYLYNREADIDRLLSILDGIP